MTMRTFAAAIVLATTALSSPTLAKDQSWYIGLEAGPNLVQNELFDIRNSAQTIVVEDGLRARHKIGYDVGGNIGYDFGKFRAEFEVAYKANKIDNFLAEKAIPAVPFGVPTLPATTVTPSVPPIGAFNAASGDARVLSFMANGLYDVGGQGTDFGGYIGAGLGIARVQHSNYALVSGGANLIDDSDTGVAWQVLAGIYKPVSDHIDLGLRYRFFNVNSVDTFTTNGLATQTRYRSHSLMFTLAYNFFVPEPPCDCAPPPPPPPPPLPPCPPAAVTPGPFLVFFAELARDDHSRRSPFPFRSSRPLAVMQIFGFSLNMLSLLGMVLAIGLVVDDAIVVVENVERQLEAGLPPLEAARKAMSEVTGPIIATTAVLMAVFIPVAFIPGVAGRLYNQFASDGRDFCRDFGLQFAHA